MSWTCAAFPVLLAVSLFSSPEADSASGKRDPKGPLQRIFMNEADASNFFGRRSRRGVKSQDEINAEHRQILTADEQKREFHEEKRRESESYTEEEHDEQGERTREHTKQWREFHYDGTYPPHKYNRHSI